MSQEGLSDANYVAQLGVVLRQQDPAGLRAFLAQRAAEFGGVDQVTEVEAQSDAEMLVLLHRMILARSDLVELHAGSRVWLAKEGVTVPTGERARRN